MANPLFQSFQQNNPMFQFIQELNKLKTTGIDPNQQIQQMLNNGQVTQEQYNRAVSMAQQIQQMRNMIGM